MKLVSSSVISEHVEFIFNLLSVVVTKHIYVFSYETVKFILSTLYTYGSYAISVSILDILAYGLNLMLRDLFTLFKVFMEPVHHIFYAIYYNRIFVFYQLTRFIQCYGHCEFDIPHSLSHIN